MANTLSDVLSKATNMDDASAKEYITNYCNLVQQQAFDDAGTLLNDVVWYMSQNSNTMKNGRNPETGEANDEVKELTPLKVTLDASKYNTIPEYEAKQDTSSNASIYIISGIAVVVAVCIIVYKNKKETSKN